MPYKVIIKKEGESNIPFRVYEIPENIDELVEFMQYARTYPDVYRIEVDGNFVWSKVHTIMFNEIVSPLLRIAGREDFANYVSLVLGFIYTSAEAEK
jgi:hypothetical protein